MNDKILESCVNDFAKRYQLSALNLSQQFCHFVNYCTVSRSTGDSFDVLDVFTDGEGDLGIDGFALLVEGHPVTSTKDIAYFRDKLGRVNAELIFVQSKSSPSFSAADIGTFLFGVRSFFGEALPKVANDEVRDAFDLKKFLYDESMHMEQAPRCTIYYATSGEWKDDPNVLARVTPELDALKATFLFSDVRFLPLDAEKLRSWYRSVRNKTVCEIVFDKHTILPSIDGITEAYLGILPCTEYLRLVTDSDGHIQRGLFYDNVRDYQGENPVNREIAQTLDSTTRSSQFVLLNNGVTIVARSISKVGAKFRITDYQIVNGCQTSHVLFKNRSKVKPDTFLPIKLVVTDNQEVTNSVIRATNRQTEVKIEAFESLSPFHRVLEEFYASFKEDDRRLYYERRSNQYASTPVEPHVIVSLTMQCKAILAMFLDEPHSTHRYYGEILATNRGRMFQDSHRPYPYYTAAFLLTRIVALLRREAIPRWYAKYKYHLLMLLRISIAGREMPPLSSKRIDEYCEKIIAVAADKAKLDQHLQLACKALKNTLDGFEREHRLAVRLRDFTARLVPGLQIRLRGVVTYYNTQKGFGFLNVEEHEDVFIHHSALANKNEAALKVGEHLEFDVVQGDRGPMAKNATVICDVQLEPAS
jgi:cold shock CspA family protein